MHSEDMAEYLETHRFGFTGNGSEKLQLLRSELKEFIIQHPELVGLTVFGSHTKGLEKPDSDIDMFLFVDEDKAEYLTNKPHTLSLSSIDDNNWTKANMKVCQPFRKGLRTIFGFDDTQLRDVRMRLISKQRIDNELALFEQYERKVFESETTGSPRPDFSDLPEAADIARMFHLQLGKGLDSYRAYILNRLETMGVIGDRVWEKFFFSQNLDEESGKIWHKGWGDSTRFQTNRRKLYPHTVKKAIEYFSLSDTAPAYDL